MHRFGILLFALQMILPLRPEAAVLELPAGGGAPWLTVYSSLDTGLAEPLLRAFQRRNPGISIRYEDLLTGELHERVIRESDSGAATADLVFSSAMDLQVKLVNDGYARSVITPATAAWPDWAMWRQAAYALTYEPAVFAWHRPSFTRHPPPDTRAGLLAWLESAPEEARGRIGTYDIARSGVGYLFLARDQDLFPGIWRVIGAMGASGLQQFPTTQALLDRIASGEIAVGYNLLGSYVAEAVRRDPARIGMTLPRDFTVVVSRVALVPRAAARGDLGAELLGWLMSAEGQEELSHHLHLPAVSLEVAGRGSPSGQLDDLIHLRLKPVTVGPGLLAWLDQATRAGLIARWQRALTPPPP